MIVKQSDFLYRFLLMLLTVDAALYNTTITEDIKQPIHDICIFIGLATAFLCIAFKKYTSKILIFHIALFLFAIVSYIISGNSDILMSILLVMLAWKMNIDNILCEVFEIRFIVFACVIMLAFIGILDKGVIADISANKGVMLGYGHANTFAGAAGILIFLMFAINRRNIRNIHIFIAIIADILVFYFSRSRTALLLITFAIIFVWLHKHSDRFSSGIRRISLYVLPVLLIVLFVLIKLRTESILPRFVDIVDWLMNGRILLASMNLRYYPITVLGQKVDLTIIASQNKYFALDNGYTYILIHYGIVGLAIITGLQELAVYRCKRANDTVLCILCVLIMVWLMYEGMMVSATSNFTLLFATAFLKNNTNNNRYNTGAIS